MADTPTYELVIEWDIVVGSTVVSKAFNVLHFAAFGDALSDADQEFLAGVVVSWWTTSNNAWSPVGAAGMARANFKAATRLANSYMRQINPFRGPKFTQQVGGLPLAGTEAGSQLPPNCSLCVTVRSNLQSRSGRGRVYLPPVGVEYVDAGGGVNSSLRGALGNQVASLAARVVGNADLANDLRFCVWSRKNLAPRSVVINLTNIAASSRIDTQRRRLPNEYPR